MQVTNRYSDAELVNALKNPTEKEAAIKAIYKECSGVLENFVVNNNGNKDDAADIIQETIVAFIEIVEQDKYRGEARIESFLYSIARNLWLNELRKRNNTESRNKIFEKSKDCTEHAIVDYLMQREQLAEIQQLFGKLGENCKRLLMMVYYEELSMSDIIKKIPDYQSEQVLRNKKCKCMKQLAQMMQGNEELRKQLKNALKHAG